MIHDTTRKKVDAAIRSVLESSGRTSEAISIQPEMKLNQDFSLDSLDMLQLITSIEDEFGIEVSDDVFARVTTVGDLYAYLEQQKQ